MIVRRGEVAVGEGPVHRPVLADAVLAAFGARTGSLLAAGGWMVDVTLGAAGHATRALDAFEGARLLGIDQDAEILPYAERELARFGERARVRHGRFTELGEILAEEGIGAPAALVADLGVSSLQFDRPGRGFSFREDGPLDMRMDTRRDRTAADVVNTWDEEDLADLFYYEGGERRSRRVARAIVDARRRAPFLRTLGLAEVVGRAVGGREGRIHPATRTFQALRRAVNEEGEELCALLDAADALLADEGCLAVISFHSAEDVQVKRFLSEGADEERWEPLTKKPVVPSESEVRANRRARSAKLRAAVRTRAGGMARVAPQPPDIGGGRS